MSNKKYIYAVDFVLLVGAMVFISLFLFYTNSQGFTITGNPILEDDNFRESQTLFSFDKQDYLIIYRGIDDENPEKILLSDGLELDFIDGIYYFEFENETKLREVDFRVPVVLGFFENEGKYLVVNLGNSRLNVEVYESGKISDKIFVNSEAEK